MERKNMTSSSLASPPAIEPVTLDELKAHCRVDTTADDALLTALIVAARQWAEHYTGRAFISQTWQYWIDADQMLPRPSLEKIMDVYVHPFGNDPYVRRPRSYIPLPHAPLQSVASVQFFDDTDTATVWDPSNYFVDNAREPGRVVLRTGAVWPCPMRMPNGLMIQYVAGYGATADMVPEVLNLAIKQIAAHWYEHRGEAGAQTDATQMPLVIQSLLNPYRIQRLGALV